MTEPQRQRLYELEIAVEESEDRIETLEATVTKLISKIEGYEEDEDGPDEGDASDLY